jgi:hypothetical protein
VPLTYFHVVFTVPHQLSELMLQNKRVLYDLLFNTVANTLLEVAANPKRLGAGIGFLCVLHTWGRRLFTIRISTVSCRPGLRSRAHTLGASETRRLLPAKVRALRGLRGKFTDGLKSLFRGKKLAFYGSLQWLQEPRPFAKFLHALHRHAWVVDVRKPFRRPRACFA